MALSFDKHIGQSESGNNYNAARVNKDGREFVGRLQFGRARLKDLGMGKDFTWEQFKKDPAIQKMVEGRHWADFDNRMAKDGTLERYAGLTINGVKVTPQSLKGMAHLGGYGGMQKFLQSGGKYNPSDELGTSLKDYGMKFSLNYGGEDGLDLKPEEMPKDRLRFGKDVPSYDDPREDGATPLDRLQHMQMMSARSSDQLRAFADNMGETANQAAQAAQTNAPTFAGLELDMGNKALKPTDSGQEDKAAATAAGLAAGSPTGQPGVAGGVPFKPDMGAPSGGAPVTRVSTSGGGASSPSGEPEQQGFIDKLAGKLFKNAEDPRQKFSDVMMGLSKGLGQMSHGQPVDLSSVMNRIQNRSALAAQEQQQAFQNQLQTRRVQLEADRLQLDRAKAAVAAKGGAAADYASLGELYPELAPVANLAQQGDKEAQKQVAQFLAEKAAAQHAESPEEAAALSAYVQAPDSESRIRTLAGLSPEARARVIEQGGQIIGTDVTDPSAVRMGERLYEENPSHYENVGEAIKHAAKLNTGTGTIDPVIRAHNLKEGTKIMQDYNKAADQAASSRQSLQLARDATNSLIQAGTETSETAEGIISAGKLMDSVLPGGLGATLLSKAGFDPKGTQMLTVAEQQMMRAIAQGYTGQGSISDVEREKMAAEIAGKQLTNRNRLSLISRLETLGKIDKIKADLYLERVDYKGDKLKEGEFSNYIEADQYVRDLDDAILEVMSASTVYGDQQWAGRAAKSPNTPESAKEIADAELAWMEKNPKTAMRAALPTLHSNHAKIFTDALPLVRNPDAGEGSPLKRAYIDSATGKVVFLD